jgi:hypothetical protein
MKNAWVLIFLLLISFLIADGVQPVGAGTQVNPYQIETLDNLLWVSTTSSSWGSTFIQFADIDASDTATWNLGYGFVPIGNTTTSFTGSFDGQNHSISGLLINRVANNQALFGELSGATISDLGLTGCNITGVDKVGGIAAEMNTSTTITRCFTTGSITGQDMVGGIAGNIRGASTISQSYNTASITAFEYGGGIAGKNRGSSIIELCYNLGSVDDGTFLGGITGYNDSSLIHNCYNSGEISGVSYLGGLTGLDTPVANVTDSFWDIEASGCTFSEGGIGLTTEQMCTLSIYTGSGWDFIDETTNGTNDYWGMHFIENAGYPFLSFQSFTHYPPSEVVPAGLGTTASPYLVSNLDHLLWISTHSDSWDKVFSQTQDIDASGTLSLDGGNGFFPIGNGSEPFIGEYHGQSFSISNLYVSHADVQNQGLFGSIDFAILDQISISNCNVTGNNSTGGLSGHARRSTIESCSVSGNITGEIDCGGLVGKSQNSTILNCSSSAVVDGYDHTGGLLGNNTSSAHIEQCWSESVVNSYNRCGGLVGYNSDFGSISQCWSNSTVTLDGLFQVGGFVGLNTSNSTISQSYSHGTVNAVSGSSYMGGFTGGCYYDGTITDCYSTAAVGNQGTYRKGFCGSLYEGGQVVDCFWDIETSNYTSSAGATGLTTAEMQDVGIYFEIDWDFMNETLFGTDDVWGLNTTENYGYPFLSWQGFSSDYIGSAEPSGSGVVTDPYQISSYSNLAWISLNSQSWDRIFYQTASIDASLSSQMFLGEGHLSIGTSEIPFIGEYHGQSFSISNLYVSHADVQNQGLFGSIDFAILDQISISNCNVTGNNSTGGLSGHARRSTIESCSVSGNITGEIDCGGLVGKSQNSTILNCSSSAVVDGYDHTGGLLGNNTSSAHIEQCWSESVVNSYNRCGGLVGYNSDFGSISQCWSNSTVTLDGLFQVGGFVGLNTSNSTISQSYSHGTVNAVSGSSYMGGFTGGCYYDGTITDCYSTAAVGNQGTYRKGFCGSLYEGGQVVDCFWDIETSNYTSSAGATGLTTAEMQEYNTFVAAGWDLPDEDGNGTNDYWGMHPEANSGYPFLSWQGFEHLIYRSQQPIGAGTIASPYIISSIDNLGWVSLHEESWDSFFQQDQDIDATITQNWDSNTGFIAIGNEITPFTGVWSGQRNNVTNLTINKPTLNEQGLFGNVSEAQISGISLINCDVTGLYRVGGIAGYSRNSSVVEECFVTGTLSSFHTCGGIVGRNSDSSQINNCYSTAAVSGENNQGGITGRSDALSIVSNCYSFGTIAGIQSCGGIVGKNQNSLVEFSYSTGAVSGSSGVDVGGLIGYSGNQTGTTCFWNIDTSGQLVSAGGIGLNTQQMNEYTTYQTAGWDFVNETANGTDSYWNMDGVSNSGYPWLNWQEIDPVASQVPQNVAISTISNQVHLSWDALSAPVDFHVYSSDNPTTGFVLDTSGTFTSTTWIAPVTEQRKFYRITTDNSSRFMRSTSVRGDLQGHTRTDRD